MDLGSIFNEFRERILQARAIEAAPRSDTSRSGNSREAYSEAE